MATTKVTTKAKNVGFICPHCDVYAQFNHLGETEYKTDAFTYYYTLWECEHCKKVVFRCYSHSQLRETVELLAQYPSKVSVPLDFVGRVPEGILEDFASAVKCYEFHEFRATAAMCRRSLQASLLDHGADRKKDLYGQVDELHSKDPNKFPAQVRDWAHNIRIFGNWGVHPDNDNLQDVDEETALEVMDFLRQYFSYVYVMPLKIEGARQKVAEKKRQKHEQQDQKAES